MHIMFASASSGALRDAAQGHVNMDSPPVVTLSLFLIGHDLDESQWERFRKSSKDANLFIYDPHGANNEIVQAMSDICASQGCDQFSLMENGEEAFRFGSLRKEDLVLDTDARSVVLSSSAKGTDGNAKKKAFEQYRQMKAYWHASGYWNWQQLFYYVAEIWGQKDVPKAGAPAIFDEDGIVDPGNGAFFRELRSYYQAFSYDASKPTVVFLYLASQARVQTAGVVHQLKKRLEPTANVVPIGIHSLMKVDANKLERLLSDVDGGVQLLVNFIGFRLGTGPIGKETTAVEKWLARLEVPMFHPFFLTRTTLEDWEQAKSLTPVETMVNIVLPEIDGAIETYPLAAVHTIGFDEKYQFEKKELALIEERTKHFISRVENWLRLRKIAPKEKRIALIGYNYPPGEGNLFGAAFLDTFSSLSALLHKMADDGYRVTPMTPDELERLFRKKQLINDSGWEVDEEDNRIRYQSKTAEEQLAGKAGVKTISEEWGAYPGGVMVEEDAFLIPGFINGNVFIGLQPSRKAGTTDTASSYHDQSLTPHHQYAAFYNWVEKEFQADAIVHVGTHGTLEYLPGKENGMSAQCFPDQLLGRLPHFYVYYVGNPSEAMIAKRRTHAVLSSYQAPPFRDGGLYGVYLELERLLHEYREAEQLDPNRLETIEKEIEEKGKATGFTDSSLEEVEDELQRMQYAMIPYGLHVLGKGLEHEDALQHAYYALKHVHNGDMALPELVMEAIPGSVEEAAKKIAERWLEDYVVCKKMPDVPIFLQTALKAKLELGMRIYVSAIENEELTSLMNALEGKYLTAKLAGDVLRNPGILPSGSNLYQFDPRAVPSSSAVKRGWEIAEATLAKYKENKGKWPRTVACVLWGVETSRTQGETIGQILAYVGAKAVKPKKAGNTEFELIPLSKLERPRINVNISMSGVFRDLFSNVIDTLNVLFQKLAEVEESAEDNFFKEQSDRVKQKLAKEGMDGQEAAELASARIFGPAEGEYGTGVSHMIEDGAWSKEAELGELHQRHAHHVYSATRRGSSEPALYEVQMKATEIVSQLRASHEYEVTDIDDYYNFFGGLAKSIETMKGEKAPVYITDTTQTEPRTESVKTAIDRGVRTRLLNPKWIKGLLEHPYHGVQKIAKQTGHLIGLAATTNEVDDWVFSAVNETYVEDENRQQAMRAANPHAYRQIVETLIEVSERGYWQPDESQWEGLKDAYLETEADMEV